MSSPRNSEREQVGLMVAGMGLFYIAFGVSMMFDRALLACGNLMFITGVIVAVGFTKVVEFTFNKSNVKGTIFFSGGVLLVLVQWPILGLIAESIGFIVLFRLSSTCLFFFISFIFTDKLESGI